jgi:hypothetical protein
MITSDGYPEKTVAQPDSIMTNNIAYMDFIDPPRNRKKDFCHLIENLLSISFLPKKSKTIRLWRGKHHVERRVFFDYSSRCGF